MSTQSSKRGPVKGESRGGARLRLAAIGLEAEFTVEVDGRHARPERVFGSPAEFLSGAPMHRTGTSYHIPTGGAVYFDTGVIEVATPAMEIEPGCAARAGRSLWEGIRHLRADLDAWERRTGRTVRLGGFSAHYNVSFDVPRTRPGRRVEDLAWLLAHLLPFPVALLAANRRSTGVGVRPRGDRVEVTVDFTPSAALTVATATLVTGVTRAVMRWPSFRLGELARRGLPRLRDFRPVPHTSRHGWLARFDCFPRSPFHTPLDECVWETESGPISMRSAARRVVHRFAGPIRRISDPFTWRLILSVAEGRAPALLDLPERPDAYDDVGRLCAWDDLFPERALTRSRYERVLIRAISGRALHMAGRRYVPVGMRGWSEVVFRDDAGGTRVFPVDHLVQHLERWERAG